MSSGLAVPLCAAFIVAIVAVLRFGWPRLRWRAYNQVHGDLRIIEIAVMLSRAGVASRAAFLDAPRRLVQGLVESVRGRPARSANAAATAQEIYRNPCQDARRHTLPDVGDNSGGAAPCGPSAPRRSAECVVYVTLKVSNH